MFDISDLQTHIEKGLHSWIAEMQIRRGNELHFQIEREAVVPLTQLLHSELGGELMLMVADDRRSDRGQFEVHYLFAHDSFKGFVRATVGIPALDPTIPSLATYSLPAARFEREIQDLFGIQPVGHPDCRPLVRHSAWSADYFPLRKDASPLTESATEEVPFPFKEVMGEGIYEIPVGPVHAGIIEPGHFRFTVEGETILKMKARLYYTHKGTEKLFEGKLPIEGVELAERISGDTTVGHALAYCQALEALSGCEVPERAKLLRVIFLELERLYNHIADFGAIANDTGFAAAHAHCFRIREQLLRLNKRLTGNRLLRGGIVLGGANHALPPNLDLAAELDTILADFNDIVEIGFNNTLLTDRLHGTGQLSPQVADDYGTLGYVARASGQDRDVRRDRPFAAYQDLSFQVPVFETGDVYARTMVRVLEVRESVRLIQQAIELLPETGALAVTLPSLPAFEPAFGLVEGWRGAIVHWVMVDHQGKLHRVKVKDPSFVNWPALSKALVNNIVPDFPLCNKSFNLSYSGADL
ncbi:MAG: NADH-quinone oxidoreductase subunit C [Cyanosarcina radialis HA8281-LM2]|jgi:Ni,Fe-hydrogenase III large subunit/Ni,Fe-hydrogenase III component G|nr:NADH-quinone oxidoreductase subunit C [Cyanosarcina radialis HA8281-LM2]